MSTGPSPAIRTIFRSSLTCVSFSEPRSASVADGERIGDQTALATSPDHHRIEVKTQDSLRVVEHQASDFHRGIAECRHVEWRLAPDALQQRRHVKGAQGTLHLIGGKRRNENTHVAERLNVLTAPTDSDNRAE